MKAHRLELYKRYNRRLLRELQKFYNHRLQDLQEGGVEEKKGFVAELQPLLEKSHVIRKRLPHSYVPAKKTFTKLYDELYNGNNSYQKILESGELKDIATKEERIASVLEHGIIHIHPPKALFPFHHQRHEVSQLFREIGKHIRRISRRKAKNPFSRVAALMAIFMVLTSFTPILAQAANKAYTTDAQKTALFQNVKDEAKDVTDGIVKLVEKGGNIIVNRMHLTRAQDDAAEEVDEEPTQQQRDIQEWVQSLMLDSKEIQKMIVEEDAIHAGKALAATYKKMLKSDYKVVVYTYNSEKDSITIPLNIHALEELNQKLAHTEMTREVNVNLTKKLTSHEETIHAGLNEDGDFVICIKEVHVENSEQTIKQVNIVIMHLL